MPEQCRRVQTRTLSLRQPDPSLAYRKRRSCPVHFTELNRIQYSEFSPSCHFLYPAEPLKNSSRDPSPLQTILILGYLCTQKSQITHRHPKRLQRKADPCLPPHPCEGCHAPSHSQLTTFQLSSRNKHKERISKHLENSGTVGPHTAPWGFIENKSCLTNLIAFLIELQG